MKAIILEKRGGLCALLREDGVVVTAAASGEIGETIELDAEITKLPLRKRKWFKSVAAAFMALVILGGSYGYLTVPASAYVSLDVGETSVEISINRLGRVIAVAALNEDSEELTKIISDEIMNMKMEDSLDETIKTLETKGYLDSDESYIIAGVASDTPSQSERISAAVESSVGALREDVPLYTMEMSREERGLAREERKSPGRYIFEREGIALPHGADPLADTGTGNESGPTFSEVTPQGEISSGKITSEASASNVRPSINEQKPHVWEGRQDARSEAVVEENIINYESAPPQNDARPEMGEAGENAPPQNDARPEMGEGGESAPPQSEARPEMGEVSENAPPKGDARPEMGEFGENAPPKGDARPEMGEAGENAPPKGDARHEMREIGENTPMQGESAPPQL